jgi:hypothetical protein
MQIVSYKHPLLAKWLDLTVYLAAERCMELMAEDPERQRRRNTLISERAKLGKAQEWINSIHHKEDDEEMTTSDNTVADGFSPLDDRVDECV